MSAPLFHTADLCDALDDRAAVAEPGFTDFGGHPRFSGIIKTVRCPDDNSLVRRALEQPGTGRVLVVDGGGLRSCALLGDQLATLAQKNGWSGVVINGCVRDTEELAAIPIGIRALGSHPRKSRKRGLGEADTAVLFAGVKFEPGSYLYADRDGMLVTKIQVDTVE